MRKSRRDALRAAIAWSARPAFVPISIATNALLAACGGGGSGGPAAAAPPPPPPTSPPSGLTYPGGSTFLVGQAITPLTPTVTGSVTTYSISPALPSGLSINAATGVISGTPGASSATATYTVTASNAGGSTTATLTIAVSARLAIAAASTATPVALTPVTLTTTGLDTTKPFTVSLAYPSGKTISLDPVRTTAAGAVVLATPLYIDRTTGKTGSVSVNVTITQNSVASNAFALAIQDMPAVATYGTAPGAISRAFFNYLTVSLGRSVNYLQALQAFPANHTNTSTARAQITQQMHDAITMRNNIDMLMAGTQSSLAVGRSSAGTPIQFNASSLDMLDRVLAMHLQATGYAPKVAELASAYAPAGQPQSAELRMGNVTRHLRLPKSAGRQLRARRVRRLQGSAGTPMSAGIPQAASFKDAITVLGALGGVTGMINGEINAFQPITSTNTMGDNIASGISGLAAVAGLVGLAVEAPAIITGAAIVGAVVGAYTVTRDVQNILQSPEGLTWESGAKVAFDAVGTVASVFGVAKVGTGLVREVTQALESVGGDGVSGIVMQGAGIIANMGASTLGVIALAEASHEESVHATPVQQLGLLDGTTAVTNGAGPILSGLPGVVLQDGSTFTQFTTMADQGQSFSMYVPIGVSSFNYSNMQLFPYDPVTDTGTGSSQVVDLRGLSSTTPHIDPIPVRGTCIDDDAGNPDADDPDCD